MPFCFSCREPQKAELKAWLPSATLIYLETSDLSQVSAVFTGNKDWRALSDGGDSYLSFLQNKQAALAVTGFQHSEEGTALQVRPELVLAIDTQSSEAQAAATAERILRELSRRFSGEDAGVEKQDIDGAQWLSAPGSDGKKIYVKVSGAVVLVANSEAALKQCLEVKRGNGQSLLANGELTQAREQYGAGEQIAFGYVSTAGIKELSNYLSVSYALKSSENELTREMVAEILPSMMQSAVNSIVWTAKAANTGVEDTYYIRTEKSFADVVFRSVKVAASAERCDSKYLPRDNFSASCYRLEDPRLAWRGAVLSLAEKLDPRALPLFEQFSGQLLKPYGIDDPELFLGNVGTQIVTVRFDADGNSAAAIVKVKDKEKPKTSIAETFDFRVAPELKEDAELWTSRDREFIAAFAGDDLIIGNSAAVLECLRAHAPEGGMALEFAAEFPAGFSGAGAIVTTRQKDDSAVRILSDVAEKRGKSVDVKSYAFVETRIEPHGIKRRSLSAFGLFGEIFRQAIE